MSPMDLYAATQAFSFPRVSGDEPRLTNICQLSCTFSPRERG